MLSVVRHARVDRVVRFLRARSLALVVALGCLLYIATWPGSRAPLGTLELGRPNAPEVPRSIRDRDGVLDITVTHAAEPTDAGASSPSPPSPIEGARVRIFAMLDGRAHTAREAITDVHGRATLGALPRARHVVLVTAEGRARASRTILVGPGLQQLEVSLDGEHRLEVRVRDDAGEPVVDAEIEARFADPVPVAARTDAHGHALLRGLGEGPFNVTARAPGFETVARRHVPESEPCTITLGRQGALAVTVVDELEHKVHHARVFVTSPALGPARVAETDADGSARIAGLDPGSYTLRASLGTKVSQVEMGVVVGRGQDKSLTLRLGAGAMISVRVVDGATDDGISGAKVTLTEQGLSAFPIEGVATDSGHVVLGPIEAGVATITARAQGFVSKLAVVDARSPKEVTVALSRGGALVGRVVDARGYPIDGATVRIIGTDLTGMPIDEDPTQSTFRDAQFDSALGGALPLVASKELGYLPGPIPKIPTRTALPGALATKGPPGLVPWISERDGTFRAEPIPEGRVRAVVHHPQYVDAMSEAVSLVAEGEARVTVVLKQGGTLLGRVVDTRGRPIDEVTVTALARRGTFEQSARPDTDGTFAFAAVPEAVAVRVRRDGALGQADAQVDVDVPDGARRSVEIVLPDPREALAVRVTDGRHGAIDAAQISAVSLDPKVALRVTAFSNAGGEASLAGARGVPLRIEVRAHGYASRFVVTTAATDHLDVALDGGERVMGEIVANRREAIEGAEIALHAGAVTMRGRTDKDGAFSFDDAPRGPAQLHVRARGRASFVRDLTIEDSGGRRATDVGRITLAEEGAIAGVVTDERGRPIAGARVARDFVPTYAAASGPPAGVVVCDAKGRFRLGELAEGSATLEAYAPSVGRGHVTGVPVVAGRTNDGITIALSRHDGADMSSAEEAAGGGVAVTLAQSEASGAAGHVRVVAVADGSEAERAGLVANDVIVAIDGTHPKDLADARTLLDGSLREDVVVTVRRGAATITTRLARERVAR